MRLRFAGPGAGAAPWPGSGGAGSGGAPFGALRFRFGLGAFFALELLGDTDAGELAAAAGGGEAAAAAVAVGPLVIEASNCFWAEELSCVGAAFVNGLVNAERKERSDVHTVDSTVEGRLRVSSGCSAFCCGSTISLLSSGVLGVGVPTTTVFALAAYAARAPASNAAITLLT